MVNIKNLESLMRDMHMFKQMLATQISLIKNNGLLNGRCKRHGSDVPVRTIEMYRSCTSR